MDVPSDRLRMLVQRRELLVDVSDGVTDRRELASRAEDSQSTVYRALKDLSEVGLLVERHGEYEPTALCEYLFGRVHAIHAAATVLDDIDGLSDAPGLDLVDPCVFEGATVTTAERHAPGRPLEPVIRLLARCEELVGFTPVVFPQLASEIAAPGPDVDLELLVEPESLHDPPVRISNHADRAEALSATDVGVVEDRLPFGLFASTSPTVECCIVFLQDGLPFATLHSATDDAGEWALDLYDEYRHASTSLDPATSDGPVTASDAS